VDKVIIELRTDFGDGRKNDCTRLREVITCHKMRKTIPPMKDKKRYLSFSRFICINHYLFKDFRSESSTIEFAFVDFLISPSFNHKSPVLSIREYTEGSEL